MTILPKPFSKKNVDILPLFNDAKAAEANQDQIAEVILVRKTGRSSTTLHLYLLTVFLLGSCLSFALFKYFRHEHTYTELPHYYRGWCSLPYSDDDVSAGEPYFRVLPVRQNELSLNGDADVNFVAYVPDEENLPDVEVIQYRDSIVRNDASLEKMLHEMFEINDRMEKFYVNKKEGGFAHIMHDFTVNKSGIIEPERCYVMDLDDKVVMPPTQFVASLQREPLDLNFSILRETFRVLMPPTIQVQLNEGETLSSVCGNRTIYPMTKIDDSGDDFIIPDRKKRSAESKAFTKYAHFAGNHIQEINIVNMDDVIAYEKNLLNKET